MPPKTPKDIEWENRTLCSDESCIGVIGPDGKCKECGLPYEGKLKVSGAPSAPDVDATGQKDRIDTAEDVAKTPPEEPDAEDIDAEWIHRTLCSDGNCIGVIGPDGRCKECGKPYEGE